MRTEESVGQRDRRQLIRSALCSVRFEPLQGTRMPPRGLTPLCEKVYNGEDDIQDLMEEKDTADEVSRAQNVSVYVVPAGRSGVRLQT